MRHSTSRISENARKKGNIFKDIEFENFNSTDTVFFRFTKIQYFMYALTWPDSLIALSWRARHVLKIILEGRGFRGG